MMYRLQLSRLSKSELQSPEAEIIPRYIINSHIVHVLLRRMGRGDLWLVMAAWDLTEVERAALQARVTSH